MVGAFITYENISDKKHAQVLCTESTDIKQKLKMCDFEICQAEKPTEINWKNYSLANFHRFQKGFALSVVIFLTMVLSLYIQNHIVSLQYMHEVYEKIDC